MMARRNVLLLGYGRIGHAMQALLGKQHKVSIWDKYPSEGFEPDALEEAAPEADFVFFCMPVNAHRDALAEILPLLKKGCSCISIAKGLDENGQTAAQILADVLGDGFNYALLYGPMIAEEISRGRSGFAQVAGNTDAVAEAVCQLFSGTHLYLKPTADIAGITWSVILKNVYAPLFGINDELGLGDNMRGFLAVETLRELDSIVLQMGGREGCSYDLAGLGDLITTGTSATSHHRNIGRQLAQGADIADIFGEGIHTLAMVEKFGLLDVQQFPLFRLMCEIARQPGRTRQLMENYLSSRYSQS